MNEGCHLTKQPWPSLPYLRLLVCILNDPSWKMLWTSAEIRSPSCRQKKSVNLRWTFYRKTCRYFLILSSSSAPRLRSSPPGRLTGQLAWQLLCYEISPISIKASASQTWGKEEDAIKTRLDVNLPSLLLNFNHPSHNHITYLAIVPRTTQVTMRWSFWMRHNKRNAPGFYRGDRYQFVNSFNNSS